MKKTISRIIIVIIILWIGILIFSSFYYPNHSFETKGGWFMGPMNCWMVGMWIFPSLILVVILVFITSVFRRRADLTPPQDSDKNQPVGKNSETALEILKKRYAKGEINKEEFDRMKSDILS